MRALLQEGNLFSVRGKLQQNCKFHAKNPKINKQKGLELLLGAIPLPPPTLCAWVLDPNTVLRSMSASQGDSVQSYEIFTQPIKILK